MATAKLQRTARTQHSLWALPAFSSATFVGAAFAVGGTRNMLDQAIAHRDAVAVGAVYVSVAVIVHVIIAVRFGR